MLSRVVPGKYGKTERGFILMAEGAYLRERARTGVGGAGSLCEMPLLVDAKTQTLAGCICLRKIEGKIAEVKRLFVRPAFRWVQSGLTLTSRG